MAGRTPNERSGRARSAIIDGWYGEVVKLFSDDLRDLGLNSG
jgi:hypothetical protein